MGKFSDLTTLERNILLEYIQSGIIPSDFDIEKYDRLYLIMKKLSTSRRSRFPGKNSIDVLGEESVASRLVDDIIDGVPDKTTTLILTIPSLKIKSILTQDSVISNLPAYISSVTLDGESQKLYVYAINDKDGSYYVIDKDTDPKETLYSQNVRDLETPLGSYTGVGRLESATVTSSSSKG